MIEDLPDRLAGFTSVKCADPINQQAVDDAITTYVRVRTAYQQSRRLKSMMLPDEFIERFFQLRREVGPLCACTPAGPCAGCSEPMTDEEANRILSSFARTMSRNKLLEMQTNLIENDYDGTITA